MSEYWVSKKRYFCKYCEIYIADDAPSRQQHENGLRHKGNRDRFIRGLYKEGERRKKDQEEEKREMARIESAAQAAFSQDVGAGRARAIAPVASSSSARKPATKPANPYANYSTAASLGYTDPDAADIAAEQERHRTQGVAGEWQVVEEPPAISTPTVEPATTTEKRPAETPVDLEDTRHFKLQKIKLGTGLGQIYDPGVIALKPKKKELEESGVPLEPSAGAFTTTNSSASQSSTMNDKPKWTKIQWKHAEDKLPQSLANPDRLTDKEPTRDDAETGQVPIEPDSDTSENVPREVKVESIENVDIRVRDDMKPAVPRGDAQQSGSIEKQEAASGSSGALFRKRKVPTAGNRGRREI
ncbi:hypothetical protein E1B28_000756 [Marasmius oreades]|uniref:Matrin-type domain-containing protein n=1 Tax=Marasmius oreades TaxID=181124 RepID=A0A9P7V241_9AGAR|nr:uncharacterized protein E1B28_000756 [Marasmius oreades]KAG7098853.1 hypothetical protein E1B28_000756 [Marasmius oreades]